MHAQLEQAKIISEKYNDSLKYIKQLEKKLNIRKGKEDPYSTNTPSSKKIFKVNSTEENQQKKGGATIGHKGHGRTDYSSVEADNSIKLEVKDSNCCDNPNLQYLDTKSQVIIDFKPMKLETIRYEKDRCKCKNCKKIVSSKIPETLKNHMYTNHAIAQMINDCYLEQMPIGQVVKKYSINRGTFIKIAHKVSDILEPSFNYLLKSIRACKVVHADETTWRNDGANSYVWTFANDQFKIFLYRKSRASAVAKEVLGEEELLLILVTDRYGGYKPLKTQKQFCYAHLLRDVKKLQLEFPEDKQIENFCNDLSTQLSDAMKLRSKNYLPPEYTIEAEKIKDKIMEICKKESDDAGIQGIQNIFREQKDKLFQWVKSSDIPCENNYAERNLRPVVIARKISFGCQSDQGMKTREVLSSVLHTAKCRGFDVVQFLTDTLNLYSQTNIKDISPLLIC